MFAEERTDEMPTINTKFFCGNGGGEEARVTWRTDVKSELLGRAVMSGCSCCRTGRCPRRQVEESRKRFSKVCEEPNNQFQARWKEELTDIQVFTGCGEQRLKRT